MIETKISAGKLSHLKPRARKVIDLMEALKASVRRLKEKVEQGRKNWRNG